MKTTKLISTCGKDCNSHYYRLTDDGRVVRGEEKYLEKGQAMYVEITTLASGKKVSVTKHGQLPE